jgi:cysteinyl-tRNA synthetase
MSEIFGIMEKDPNIALRDITTMKAKRAGIDIDLVNRMIEERAAARKAKDFKKADEVRNKLLEMGITVMDTPEGTIWRIER